LPVSTQQERIPQAPAIPERVTQRPAGVTVLAALQILGGIVFFGLGVIMLAVAGFLGIARFWANIPTFPAFFGRLILGAIGGVMVVIGLACFVIAYGYLNGQGWAWTLGLAITVLSLVLGLISLPNGVIGVLVDVLIIYYLTRPRVKRFFGKEPVTVAI